jgi:hypothetical protein
LGGIDPSVASLTSWVSVTEDDLHSDMATTEQSNKKEGGIWDGDEQE